MESLSILISGVGHACWDYQLTWMASKDPDASIIHMHWLRMVIMMIFLQIMTCKQNKSDKSLWWWLKFSTVGLVIPPIMYTHAVLWTNYRIPVSFQTFIPIIVILKSGYGFNSARCRALMIVMVGTLFLWSDIVFKGELWKLWAALSASVLQVLCLSEFFVMLKGIQSDKIAAVSRGVYFAVIILLILMIIFTPRHFNSVLFEKIDKWLYILIASSVATSIKYGLIAYFSEKMTADGVAIFECVHPIATLVADIISGKDVFEWQDSIAITCFFIGWISYPKMNI